MDGSEIYTIHEDRLRGTAVSVKRIAERFVDTFVVMMGEVLTARGAAMLPRRVARR